MTYPRFRKLKIERAHRSSAAAYGHNAIKHLHEPEAATWAKKAASAALQVIGRSPVYAHPDSKRTRRSRLTSISRFQARRLKGGAL